MAKQKKKPQESIPLEDIFISYRKRVNGLSSSKARTYTISGIALSVILIAVSSALFYFHIFGSWIPAFIGAPAGVILFLISLGAIYRTSIGDWGIWQMRERLSFRRRIRRVLIWLVVYLLVFIPLGGYIPYGVGGVVIISLVLTSITFVRRTPEELRLAQEGLPDPRDVAEEEEKDEYADDEGELEETDEADTVYYDEQRGGVGGKLG